MAEKSLPEQIAELGYANAEKIAKMIEHERAYMKALAALAALPHRNFRGSSHDWINREDAMRPVLALRDHGSALAKMLREELLRTHGVKEGGDASHE